MLGPGLRGDDGGIVTDFRGGDGLVASRFLCVSVPLWFILLGPGLRRGDGLSAKPPLIGRDIAPGVRNDYLFSWVDPTNKKLKELRSHGLYP